MTNLVEIINKVWDLRERVAWRELTPWEQEALLVKELDAIYRVLREEHDKATSGQEK